MSPAEQPAPKPPDLRAAEDPDSPKARARALRATLAADKSMDLIVPGYAGLLGIRYKPVPEDDWRDVARRLMQAQNAGDEASGLEVALDIVIASCDAVIWRNEQDEPWEVITDDADQPLRFDVRLAEWLGFDASSAREVVRGVFSPEGTKPISPAVHGDAVAEWMRGNEQAINRALLGK